MSREEITNRIKKIDENLFVLEMCDHYDSKRIYELERERDELSKQLIRLDETTKES